jgi:hypothetical protein
MVEPEGRTRRRQPVAPDSDPDASPERFPMSRFVPLRRAAPLALALAAVVALTAAAAPARAAVAPEAAPVIEKYVAWLGGWQELDSLRDLSLEGAVEVAGLKGTLSLRLRQDGRQRTEYDLKVIKGVDAVDGDDAWALNASGQVEDLGRAKVLNAQRSLDRAFNRHLRGEGVEVTRPADEDKDGRTWAVLRFTYPDGDQYDILVDAATGESAWARDTTDGHVAWSHESDIREVDGHRFAFRQDTIAEQAIENQTVTWTSVKANTGLGDDVFHRPGATAANKLVHLPAGVTATAWLPIELHLERYIYLKGTVDGVPTDILLDSGAGMTVLDTAMAKKLGRESKGAMPAQGVGGTTTAGLVEGITIELGELTLGPVVAATLDLGDIGKRLGRDMPVILGKEVFQDLIVDLDYPNQRIRFLDPATFTYDGAGHRLEVLPADDGHKLVKLAIEGLPEATVMLDTGQGNALTLFRRYTDDNSLLDGRRQSKAVGGGVGGSMEIVLARVAKVTIAGYEMLDVPTSFHRQDVGGAFDTAKLAGNLGAGILGRFRVVFDYPHDCLWLEPGQDFAAPQSRDRTGLAPHPDGAALVIDYIAPGSPAEAAGWQQGERVTALDGRPVDANWWKQWAVWSRAAAGTTVKLTMADGSVRELRLADYY